jgi:hypothetical protein
MTAVLIILAVVLVLVMAYLLFSGILLPAPNL